MRLSSKTASAALLGFIACGVLAVWATSRFLNKPQYTPRVFAPLVAATALFAPRPNLVVVLSIDQFRSDYMTRFEKLYLPASSAGQVGGFRYLEENGAVFVNSRYHHVPTETGPGHAVIGTGSTPGLTGIIANTWFDRATQKNLYCVEDAGSKDVFSGKPSMSPKNLRVTTMGDELELATNGQAKTASIALKDRSAILMSGHTCDGAVWMDKSTGTWTTSDYYGSLPAWAAAANALKYADQWKGKAWEAELPADVRAKHSFPTVAPGGPKGFGDTFPHTLPNEGFYNLWTFTPYANDFVVRTAEEAVTQLQMGQDDVPDILMLSFSTNDYVGHAFGPYSPESLELSVRTDASISRLLNFLDKKVPGGLKSVLFVLSADHGVVPVPEDLIARRIPAARLASDAFGVMRTKFNKAMGVDAVQSVDESMVWLDHSKLSGPALDAARVTIANELQKSPNVLRAYTADRIPVMPIGDWLDEAVRNGFDPERSPDVVYTMRPGVYAWGPNGTGHGTGWTYDTSVPLVFCGPGVAVGRFTERAGPEDIAATVAAHLGIVAPNGSIGRAIGFK